MSLKMIHDSNNTNSVLSPQNIDEFGCQQSNSKWDMKFIWSCQMGYGGNHHLLTECQGMVVVGVDVVTLLGGLWYIPKKIKKKTGNEEYKKSSSKERAVSY